jgi:hypothetical protein
MSKIKGNKELEAWAQSKITKSADYLNAVSDYMDNEEKQIEEMSNLKDADNLQIKNMQKSFGKDGAIERIMSPVNRDPKFTKDQSKKPRDSYGVSDDKQNRGLPPSSSGILNTAKEYLRKNVPSSEIVKEEEQLDEARIGIVNPNSLIDAIIFSIT